MVSLHFTSQSVLTLYGHGRTSGMVVTSGECATSFLALFDGVVIKRAAKELRVGGRNISEHIVARFKEAGYEGSQQDLMRAANFVKCNWLSMRGQHQTNLEKTEQEVAMPHGKRSVSHWSNAAIVLFISSILVRPC